MFAIGPIELLVSAALAVGVIYGAMKLFAWWIRPSDLIQGEPLRIDAPQADTLTIPTDEYTETPIR